jgi:hypothetical protein
MFLLPSKCRCFPSLARFALRSFSSQRYIFLFPGQGSQRQAMAAELSKHALALQLFETANRAAGFDVHSL